MEKILFTGGAGFIGSHVVEKYLELGHKVIVVDNFVSGRMANLENVKNNPLLSIETVDITNRDMLKELFKKYRPTVVNHHAAQKSVSYSVDNPIYNAINNEIGLLNIIDLIREFPIKRFIYVSSGGALSKEIVGNDKSTEKDMPQLESPYAITKYCGERYLDIYSKLYGFSWIGLRYANVYGPRQIADGECGVIPIFVDNIVEKKSSVLMTYDDMPRGCTRDYVNIKDVVAFNVIALNTKVGLNEVYNIGNGIEIPILDIYEALERAFGTNYGIKIVGPRQGDIRRSVLDNTKARKLLGWLPEISLEEGVSELATLLNVE